MVGLISVLGPQLVDRTTLDGHEERIFGLLILLNQNNWLFLLTEEGKGAMKVDAQEKVLGFKHLDQWRKVEL